MNEIFYANDVVLMSERVENFKEKFLKWEEEFYSKGLKINLKMTEVMVSVSKDEVLKSKINSCAQCDNWVMANFVMCTKCSVYVNG